MNYGVRSVAQKDRLSHLAVPESVRFASYWAYNLLVGFELGSVMSDHDRRQFLRLALAGTGLTLAGTVTGQQGRATHRDERPNGRRAADGLVTVTSDDDFDATVDRISSAIEDNENLTLVATVDHAANAASAGLELPPTTLLVFGNPQLGTPLMQSARSVAIDLPQKLLVTAVEGSVTVTYNDPAWLAQRHGIYDRAGTLETIGSALAGLASGE